MTRDTERCIAAGLVGPRYATVLVIGDAGNPAVFRAIGMAGRSG